MSRVMRGGLGSPCLSTVYDACRRMCGRNMILLSKRGLFEQHSRDWKDKLKDFRYKRSTKLLVIPQRETVAR